MRKDPEPLEHVPPEEVQRAQAERLLRAWKIPEGWRYWSAVNNSEVGLWYTAMTFFFR
jgi:cytochrome c oxidase subunit I+III